MIEDDDDDDDAPRRNTLTSGCPVAKIAEEVRAAFSDDVTLGPHTHDTHTTHDARLVAH